MINKINTITFEMPDGSFDTPTGLKFLILTEGEGGGVIEGQKVKVGYRGYFGAEADNGMANKTFDQTVSPDSFEFVVGSGQVIAGWDQALCGMKKGETRRITIPPHLGYGDRPPPSIRRAGRSQNIYFDITLIDFWNEDE
jgi:FKBP-type peptidyl-prolyl cis-trans isomerase FkpA